GAPPGSGLYLLLAHRFQWDTAGRVPDFGFFVDARHRLPAGAPIPVLSGGVAIDRKVNPITSWSDFELAIMPNVVPIVAEEHLDHVAVPETSPRLIVLSRLEDVQAAIGTDEQQIEIGVAPEASDFGFEIRVIDDAAAVLGHPCGLCF